MSRRSPQQQLSLFCSRVDKALSRGAVQQQTIKGAFHLSRDDGAGELTFTADQGDEDDLRSLMIDMRMFLSPNEDVSFTRISHQLERQLNDDELLDANRAKGSSWKRALRGDIGMVVNEKRYTAEDFFDLVGNSDHLHLNDQKESELTRMGPIMQGFGWAATVGMVNDCLLVLHAERNLIRRTLDSGALRFD